MTFTFKCYQNNFMIKNFNIVSFGDCFGSIIVCMAFALLLELSGGIDLYLRHYSVTRKNNNERLLNTLSLTTIRRRRFLLHLLRTVVHVAQMGLSYILMLMVMNDFAGFFLSAIIALGIGYYLLNGVHPYTRSANHTRISNNDSDLTIRTEIVDENIPPSHRLAVIDSSEETLPVNI